MRYLGIDYGEKRTGLALSDEDGRIAIPYKTISAITAKRIVHVIKTIVLQEKIGKIVVGLPIPFSGKPSHQTLAVKNFVEKLKSETNLSVEFENELFTTKMAQQVGVPAEHLDKAAAAIILQSYLDKQIEQVSKSS